MRLKVVKEWTTCPSADEVPMRNRETIYQSDGMDKKPYMMLGGLAAVIVLVVGVCCYYMLSRFMIG